MDLTDTHTYDATVDAVLDMFADPEAVTARYESMGHRDIQVMQCERTDDSLTVKTSRVVDVDLPGFAKKVLKPTNTMVQTDTWTAAGNGRWDGAFKVDVAGSPVELSGKMTLVPAGERADSTVTITMNVKVPLVGGKIADWAGKNEVRTTLDAEFAAGDAWLADHPA
jgi:hypothetical protein